MLLVKESCYFVIACTSKVEIFKMRLQEAIWSHISQSYFFICTVKNYHAKQNLKELAA